MGKKDKLKKRLRHRFDPNPNPRAWTPVRGKDALYHTSYQKQFPGTSGPKWYSTVSQRFNRVDLFKEEFSYMPKRFKVNKKLRRCSTLQSNIDRAIGGYQREQKLSVSIEELKKQMQTESLPIKTCGVDEKFQETGTSAGCLFGIKVEYKGETAEDTNRNGDQGCSSEKLEVMNKQIQSLETELRYLRQCRIPYLSRMYELKAATGDSISLPVKICGFVTAEEDIYDILFALVREKFLPERKQFIVNYGTPTYALRTAFDGINALDTDKWLCELIEYSKEDHTPRVLEEFNKGELRGIFLPLDRGFLGGEIHGTMANTGYIINFFTMPLIQTRSTMNTERIRAYWERVDYSKHVGLDHRPLTVVDFVSPTHLLQYEDMYRQKGFVVEPASLHNFDANIAKIQTPPLPIDSCGSQFRDNYAPEYPKNKSEASGSVPVSISSDSEDGYREPDSYKDFSFDIPSVNIKSEFPNQDDDTPRPQSSLKITLHNTGVKLVTEMPVKNEPTSNTRKRRNPDISEAYVDFKQEKSTGYAADGSFFHDYGHGDPNYSNFDYPSNVSVYPVVPSYRENVYTQSRPTDNYGNSNPSLHSTREDRNTSEFWYSRRPSSDCDSKNLDYQRR